jgi:hypothetical protein
VELKVVADGVLIRPVQPRLSLAERLAKQWPGIRSAQRSSNDPAAALSRLGAGSG